MHLSLKMASRPLKRSKYDIGLVSSEGGVGRDVTYAYSLHKWNTHIEEAYAQYVKNEPLPEEFLPSNMWTEWLWGFNPEQHCGIECLMNRSHLLGLLLARYRAIYQVQYQKSERTLLDILGSSRDARLCLFDAPVANYSLRQLRDTLQNIQLNWVLCDCTSIPNMKDAVNAIMHRFGTLALTGGDTLVMNDQGSIEDAPGGALAMNRICLRRFLSTLMVMYRHLHFREHAESFEDPKPFDCGIRGHHLVASTDDFSAVAMHWDAMVSSKLNYIHDFPGMYNCISQVWLH